MTTFIKQPLNALQLELLELFAREVSNQDLLTIKQMVSDFFAQKAIAEADTLWEEQGYSDDTMTEWLNIHERKKDDNASGN
jgi:hypothetical protein